MVGEEDPITLRFDRLRLFYSECGEARKEKRAGLAVVVSLGERLLQRTTFL